MNESITDSKITGKSASRRVLIIDDNPDVQEIVARTLNGSEFKVIGASTGREGIILAKEHKPDIILLDISMPGFDGFMTGKVIKRNQDTKSIPIIYISGRKTKQDITEAIQAGGSDYIVKPFTPSDLLTRIRRVIESASVEYEKRQRVSRSYGTESIAEPSADDARHLIDITMHDDVAVVTIHLDSIVIENSKVFRDTFASLIDEGKFCIVLNTWNLKNIDGAGLGLLISVNESLNKYNGGLRLLIPSQEVINRFTFVKLNDLFPLYNNTKTAIQSFSELNKTTTNKHQEDEFNICLSCTFVNAPKARYCSFCGTNLVLGKGDEVITVLSGLISARVLAESNTTDINSINRDRNILAEGYEIPSEFSVEIVEGDMSISYISTRTLTQLFESQSMIGIQAPAIKKKLFPLHKGMAVRMANRKTGEQAKFETSITSIDTTHGFIFLNYTEDAVALHSQKNFSVAPKNPFPVTFTIPNFQHAGTLYHGRILELSRVRMVVFSEDELPTGQCMALSFNLADKAIISSPLVIAQKSMQRYMYNIEFRIIDEKESTLITQYMYKRQIELAKGDII